MTYQEAIDCVYSQLSVSCDIDEFPKGDIEERVKSSASLIGQSLQPYSQVESEFVVVDSEPISEIKLKANNISDIIENQVTVDGFNLTHRSFAYIKSIKNGNNKPSYYHWDTRKPGILYVGPGLKSSSEYCIEYFSDIEPPESLDEEIWGGAFEAGHTLICTRAAMLSTLAADETREFFPTLQAIFQQDIQTFFASIQHISNAEQLLYQWMPGEVGK